jgi:hypothetical protein
MAFKQQNYKLAYKYRNKRYLTSHIFWNITSCSPLKVNGSFGGICRLHPQGRISQARNQRESRWKTEKILQILFISKIEYFWAMFFPQSKQIVSLLLHIHTHAESPFQHFLEYAEKTNERVPRWLIAEPSRHILTSSQQSGT